VTVDQPGAIVNVATITREDQFDPVSVNNQAGTTINCQQADLAVTKTVDNASPNVGDDVTFSVTVHNNGPSDANNVALADALPAGLALVSATPTQGTYTGVTGIWTVGTLTAGGASSTATLTIVANVTAAGGMTNTAAVSASDQTDPNSANNSASVSLNGNPLADLSVAKHYHRRHKVCEYHAKASLVAAGGKQQRFCQQCSRSVSLALPHTNTVLAKPYCYS
jgi:uncharacterized repeat protein (TIGR01451 family)